MALNKLTDLNNHLFAQLERLGEEDLTKEELRLEVNRAKAITEVSKNIIDNARLAFDCVKFTSQNPKENKQLPEQFKFLQQK